jgi:3-deoxy-D-manno-octulosonic acid (KDO) 8-phosphate synthase
LLFDASRSFSPPSRDTRPGRGLDGGLAEAALAVGVDGISLVVHDNDTEPVRRASSCSIEDLPARLRRLKQIERVMKTG